MMNLYGCSFYVMFHTKQGVVGKTRRFLNSEQPFKTENLCWYLKSL